MYIPDSPIFFFFFFFFGGGGGGGITHFQTSPVICGYCPFALMVTVYYKMRLNGYPLTFFANKLIKPCCFNAEM